METVVSVCAVILVVLVGLAVGYLIPVLVEARRTLDLAQVLIYNVNQEVLKLQKVGTAAANIAGIVGGPIGRTASLVMSLVSSFKSRRNGRATEHSSAQKEAV